MKTLALRARVFKHCFLVFGYPGETLALVVHILREASTFRAKALHREVSEEGLETSKFYLYFSRS